MRKHFAVLADLIIGYFFWEVCQLLPNRASDVVEMALFFYPKTFGFILLATVGLRLSFSIFKGRTIGELIFRTNRRDRTTREWLRLYRSEVIITIALFLIMTIDTTAHLLGFLGAFPPEELFAYILAYTTMSCVLLVPAFLAYLIIWTPIRNKKVMSNQTSLTTPDATRPTS